MTSDLMCFCIDLPGPRCRIWCVDAVRPVLPTITNYRLKKPCSGNNTMLSPLLLDFHHLSKATPLVAFLGRLSDVDFHFVSRRILRTELNQIFFPFDHDLNGVRRVGRDTWLLLLELLLLPLLQLLLLILFIVLLFQLLMLPDWSSRVSSAVCRTVNRSYMRLLVFLVEVQGYTPPQHTEASLGEDRVLGTASGVPNEKDNDHDPATHHSSPKVGPFEPKLVFRYRRGALYEHYVEVFVNHFPRHLKRGRK